VEKNAAIVMTREDMIDSINKKTCTILNSKIGMLLKSSNRHPRFQPPTKNPALLTQRSRLKRSSSKKRLLLICRRAQSP